MQSINFHALHSPRRGFSLIELGIVITVIGILISSIWVYAGEADKKAKRQLLKEEIATVVTNIRALYAGQAGIGTPSESSSVVMPALINQNAIPSAMVRTGGGCFGGGLCADSPWGPNGSPTWGTFTVCAVRAGALGCSYAGGMSITAQRFAIEVSGLSYENCVNIATENSGADAPSGLLDVVIDSTSAGDAGALPVTVAFASATCVALNAIDFIYRLRPAAF